MLTRVLALAACAIAAAAAAPGFALAEGRFAPWGPDPPLPPCTCRAQGQDFQMGDTICMRTPDGSRIARCVMVLNNTSWEPTATPCPQASAPGRKGLIATARLAPHACLRGRS